MRCLLLSLLVLQSCRAQAIPHDAEIPSTSSTLAQSRDFEGLVVPSEALNMRAPTSAVYLGSYTKQGGWNQFESLADDGKLIKKGELIAQFKFEAKGALAQIQQRIKTIVAEREKRMLELDGVLRTLETARAKYNLDTESARLDTLRKSVVSKREQKLAEINHALARFDSRAIRKRIKAHRVTMQAAEQWFEKRKNYADDLLRRYRQYEENREIRAPFDGVVRHGRHPWHRRKILKSDGIPPGHAILSFARNQRIAIQFFIPEATSGVVHIGDSISVIALSGDVNWSATVKKIDFFPQEVGFIRKNEELPNAREKVYVGFAELPPGTVGLIAGNEVRVIHRGRNGVQP
jgi:hypothetical protein